MHFTITYSFDIETNQYIAEIPELNLSDFGDTFDEADKNVKNMLSLYIEEITATPEHDKKLQHA